MRLWTIHKRNGFSLSEGSVDHSKSDYYRKTRGIKEAYQQLWPHIGVPNGQVIWCYTQEGDIPRTNTLKTKWSLQVPENGVIKYVDDIMWNCILGIRVHMTPCYRRVLRAIAGIQFPYNGHKRRAFEKELEKEFWQKKHAPAELWDKLLLDEAIPGSSALIRHPIPREWIIKSTLIRCA